MAKKTKPNSRAATIEDVKLGNKIRAYRNAVQMSQNELGAALDPPVSFQQVQKYEKGSNRVSHVKLMQICKALGITMNDMLGDMKGEGQTSAQSAHMIHLLGDHATYRMVKAFVELPRDTQYKFVALVESVQHGQQTS